MPVGNDVVDLTDAETRSGATHPRFLARVCRDEEIARIAAAADPRRMLWAHWAAKESAFKALRKLRPALPFIPRRFAVSFDIPRDGEPWLGSVEVDGHAAAVRVGHETDYLHAVAEAQASPTDRPRPVAAALLMGVHELPVTEVFPAPSARAGALSAAARRHLIAALAGHLGCAESDLAVVRPATPGIPPCVTLRGKPSALDVSLSHHGRLVAFAALRP